MGRWRKGVLTVSSSVAFVVLGGALVLVPTARSVPITIGVLSLLVGWCIASASLVKLWRLDIELLRLRKELSNHDERERERTNRLERAIEEERAKESRHEYHMEQSLKRIETRGAELSAQSALGSPWPSSTNLDVLFVTSNGAGLGHLSRLLAIAQSLGSDTRAEFLTLSTAYRTFSDSGYVVHYFPSAEAAQVPPARWNRRFSIYVADLMRERVPNVVVFDGTWVYHGLTEVCRSFGIPLVWVQRGNWKDEVDKVSVQRHDAGSVVDEVIIPADFAVPEHPNIGSEITPHRVGPITLVRRSQMLTRQDALNALGLDHNAQYILANLGGGILSDSEDELVRIRNAVDKLDGPWRVVAVRSPLSTSWPREQLMGVIEISAYPMAKFMRAFEYVISAAGYNSVQEAISLEVPSIFVPNKRTATDNQTARALGASERGFAIAVTSSDELESAIVELADSGRRAQMHEQLSTVEEASGAAQAAAALSTIIARSKWVLAADTVGTQDA